MVRLLKMLHLLRLDRALSAIARVAKFNPSVVRLLKLPPLAGFEPSSAGSSVPMRPAPRSIRCTLALLALAFSTEIGEMRMQSRAAHLLQVREADPRA